MSISLKIEKKFSTLGKDMIDKAKKGFYRDVAEILPNVIADNIRKGISPVEGVGRFQQYSKSYVEQIEHNRKADKNQNKQNDRLLSKGRDVVDKRGHKTAELFRGKLKSPVNLFLSGKMMNSLHSKVDDSGVTIGFDSKIAKYHNGDGKVLRPLLPKDGQSFSSLIMKKLRDLLRNNFKN